MLAYIEVVLFATECFTYIEDVLFSTEWNKYNSKAARLYWTLLVVLGKEEEEKPDDVQREPQ